MKSVWVENRFDSEPNQRDFWKATVIKLEGFASKSEIAAEEGKIGNRIGRFFLIFGEKSGTAEAISEDDLFRKFACAMRRRKVMHSDLELGITWEVIRCGCSVVLPFWENF
ncbi:hypothetical protein U1Q18_001837 [Sarracenia purpurea var. burkii]